MHVHMCGVAIWSLSAEEGRWERFEVLARLSPSALKLFYRLRASAPLSMAAQPALRRLVSALTRRFTMGRSPPRFSQ